MLLKSVEMFGFKSFPERTRMDFERGITIVVGPNGCGKSNISDAVRWVFGERSTKALRSKKMEDVIFAGTADRPASGFAEVSLFLDNTDRGLDVDEDEVCVTRRIYRSGETEYLINKKGVRLADLLEVFMDTGLGRDGYSLIGQGKIAEIVSAKSEERREIFEEAAGISKHRYRREEAEKNLAKAGENLVRLTDIASELESRIEPLRVAAEKAKKYIELTSEKTGLELGVWLHTLAKASSAVREYEQKEELVRAGKNECEIKSAEISATINEIFNSSQSYNIMFENKRREQEACTAAIAQLNSSIELQKGEIGHMMTESARIEQQTEQLRALIADSEQTVRQSREKIDGLHKKCLELEAEVSQTEAELAQLNAGAGGAEQRFSQLYGEIEAASNELNGAKIERVGLLSNIEQAQLRLGEHSDELEKLKPQVSELAEDEKLLADDSKQIAEDVTACRNSRDGNEMKLQNLRTRRDALREDISKNELAMNECLHRAQALDDMEKQMEGYGGAVKAVLTRAEKGDLRGVCGVVARLLTVADKYASAIEVALGGAMQDIVVETENDAKYAINYLKNGNLGRATFLPVSAIKGDVLNPRDFVGCTGYLGAAVDIIGIDGKYRGIFNRLLGRTALFDNLDNAVESAVKTGHKYRIVTLDGQVINAGGSMTGGSLSKTGSTISRANQIKNYRDRAQQLEKELAQRNADYEKLCADCEKAQRVFDSGAGQLAGLNEEKLRIDMSLAQLQKELASAKEQIKTREAAVAQLKKQLQADGAEDERLVEKIAVAEKLLEAKNAESRVLSEGRSDFFAKREAFLERISQLRLDIAEHRKDISVLTQGIEMSGADREQKLLLIDGCAAQQAEIEAGKQRSMQTIAGLESDAENMRAKSEGIAQELERIISDRNRGEQRLVETREKEKEIMQTLQQMIAEQTRLSERKDTAQRDYDNTVSRLWDEYGITPEEAAGKAAPIESITEANRNLSRLRDKIRSLGVVNTAAQEEYEDVTARYGALKAQIDDIEKSCAELRKLIAELNVTMTEMFTKTFEQINEKFKEVFVELFGGGKAELTLEDPDNVLDCGIDIKAQPPGKSVKSLELLSGGEQSFLAVAIYFAILKVKPSPFCLLDEIEAALDEINVSRFADYLRAMSGNTQFIVITHRRGTMEIGDSLYGVTMQRQGQTSGVSKVLHLRMSEVEQKLGIKL